VPRHPHHFEEVAALLDASGLPWQRRSRLDADGPNPAARVLLVDTVGELAAWWGMAAIAYVGGSMGSRGGQNMIEPAAFGAAVSFGPHTENFRDVTALLLDNRAAVVVRDGQELSAFVQRCLEEEEYAELLGARARDLVARQGGACSATLRLLGALLESRLTHQPLARRAA
jgi:3-deoxy-D-manno-octulosonic-acid transferase